MPSFSTNQKIALITGGGSGIGLATARALAEKGFTVIITGRRQETLDDALASLPAGRAHAIAADISDPASVEHLFQEIEERFGRLDLLFNNAGRSAAAAPVDEISLDAWKSVIDTNLTGAFLCTQAAVRLMKRQNPHGGRIVNNGSVSATTPRLHSAAYTASKHAITGLTKSTALDCRHNDIACGQIDIGNAMTDLSSHSSRGTLQADGSTRVEAMMDAKAVADAICYMADLPLEANALFLTVHATRMPFVGRGWLGCVVGSILLVYPAFYLINAQPSLLLIMTVMVVLMMFYTLGSAPSFSLMPENFPKHIRAAYLSSAYAVSVLLFGGTTSLFATWLIKVTGNNMAPAWYMVVSVTISLVAISLMTEIGNKKIDW